MKFCCPTTPWPEPSSCQTSNCNLNSKQPPASLSSGRELVVNLVSGCAGGAANAFLGQPLETAKTKLQIFPSYYKGAVHCLKETWRLEGIRGVYSGLAPNMMVVLVENTVLFILYPWFQQKLATRLQIGVDDLSPLQKASAGSLASVASATAMTPAEVVKCRLQVMRENFVVHHAGDASKLDSNPRVTRVIRDVLLAEGAGAFVKGIRAALPRDIIGGFFYFGTYESVLKVMCERGQRRQDIHLGTLFLAGGVSGVVMWLVSYPFDVVKARLQNTWTKTPPSAMALGLRIVREEGHAALWSGIRPVLCRTFPGCGAFFVVYETLRAKLRRLLEEDASGRKE